jgi:hypothetical protein
VVKVVGTLGQREPFPAASATAPAAPPAPAAANPSEHPLVKRAAELFGRRIGDGAQ